MKQIQLTQNKTALVDDEDYKRCSKYKWQAFQHRNTWYARGYVDGKNNVRLHRFILSYAGSNPVDHIDGDGLNNQKQNLRVVTTRLNSINRKKKGKYLPGTCPAGKKFSVIAQIRGRSTYLGIFETQEEAHKRYMAFVGDEANDRELGEVSTATGA